MYVRFFMLLVLCPVLLGSPGMAQDTSVFSSALAPHDLVEFNFTNSDITDVIHHLTQLTGWSVFYDPTQVRGKITIVTPGKVPLAHAVRLLQGVTRPYSHAIQVLTPNSPQAMPLAAVLTALSHSTPQPDAVVWRNSDARGPQSRPYSCAPQHNASPLLPFWVDVLVDQRR
jgi:type II secretory pathway component GspD/PulD (secretin)